MTVIDEDRADFWITFESEEERDAIAHGGDCEDDARAAVKLNEHELDKIPEDSLRKAIKVTGAYTEEELKGWDKERLLMFVIWMAAFDALDQFTLEVNVQTY